MLYSELESKSLAELLDAFRGPPPDGEAYRASFFDDVAHRIAELGGIEELKTAMDTNDDDRLAAVVSAFSAPKADSVPRSERETLFRRFLTHPNPSVVAAAIDGLVVLDDHQAKATVLNLLRIGPSIVRARALIYLRSTSGQEAIPLLLAALNDPHPTIRLAAVDELDNLDEFNDRATFERMLNDADDYVRDHARYIVEHHFA